MCYPPLGATCTYDMQYRVGSYKMSTAIALHDDSEGEIFCDGRVEDEKRVPKYPNGAAKLEGGDFILP